jgi:hypothetical protein
VSGVLLEKGKVVRAFIAVLGVVVVSFACADGFAAAAGGTPAVALRSGHIGRYEWWADLEAPESEAERGNGEVCLAISMLEPLPGHRAEGNEVAGCGNPPGRQPVIEYLKGGSGERVRTVLAALFPAGVRRVHLKLVGRPGHDYPAGVLDQGAAQGITSSPLAFFARGFSSSVCIQHLVGYGAEGAVLSHLGRQSCR